MLVRDLSNVLTGIDPDSNVRVVLYTTDGRQQSFDIIDVTSSDGNTHIEISEDHD